MIIVIKHNVPEIEIRNISRALHDQWGINSEKIVGRNRIIIGLIGDTSEVDASQLQKMSPWIEQVIRI
jgi:3-deoxy-7-phosphoheptulonate synthase